VWKRDGRGRRLRSTITPAPPRTTPHLIVPFVSLRAGPCESIAKASRASLRPPGQSSSTCRERCLQRPATTMPREGHAGARLSLRIGPQLSTSACADHGAARRCPQVARLMSDRLPPIKARRDAWPEVRLSLASGADWPCVLTSAFAHLGEPIASTVLLSSGAFQATPTRPAYSRAGYLGTELNSRSVPPADGRVCRGVATVSRHVR